MSDEGHILVTRDNLARVARGLPFLLRRLLAVGLAIEAGRLEVALPDGRELLFAGGAPGPSARLAIRDPAFARRVVLGGEIGFAEAYVDGLWDTPDLAALLLLFATSRPRDARVVSEPWPRLLLRRIGQALRRNTRAGARRNIADHYDLGEAFYGTWLDRDLTYSSAIFAEGDDLEAAQARKNRRLAEATRIEPASHVLEIGCGWGSFALFAAREIGCRVTALTISQAQADVARRRVQEAGLTERIEIRLEDYRDVAGGFDRIVSIEMLEAVGEPYWERFFRVLHDRLVPGGFAGLQAITICDARYPRYRTEIDFIRARIFPGGMLPSDAILTALPARAGLATVEDRSYAADYARTLAIWRARVRAAGSRLDALGFDARFRRMWDYYLAYCETGFATRNTDVRQMVVRRG